MGLKATYEAIYDKCGKMVTTELVLDEWNIRGILEHEDDGGYSARSYATDLWTPTVPDGWIQEPNESGVPKFYCSYECAGIPKDTVWVA